MSERPKGKPAAAHRRRQRAGAQTRIVHLEAAVRNLRAVNEEIRYRACFHAKQFSSGVIAFRPRKLADPKQINHEDKDVLCHVLKGSGRLRTNGQRIQLRPGMICHIPKNTPHDFAAGKRTNLILFYSLIKTI